MTQPDPPPVLQYALPVDYIADEWARDGVLIVGPRNTPLPDRCIRCNEPIDANRRWRKTLYWQPKALGFLALGPGLLVYALVSVFVRKSSKVTVGLCENHWRIRRRRQLSSVFPITIGLIAVAVAIWMMNQSDYQYSLLPVDVLAGGLVLAIGGIIYLNIVSKMIIAKKIEGDLVWYRGASSAFLSSLGTVLSR